MARNIAQGLDRLERLAAALLQPETAPFYLRPGEPIPEGINPERVMFIARTFVEAPEREEVALPEMPMESEPEPERVKTQSQASLRFRP